MSCSSRKVLCSRTLPAHLGSLSLVVFGLATPGVAQQTPEGWSYQQLYAEGISASHLLESSRVFGPEGAPIGDVANLVISFDGEILSLIAGVGGRWNIDWDIGETFVNVPWEEVTWTAEGPVVPLDVESLDAYPLFPNTALSARQAGTDITQLAEGANALRAFKASELLGDYARLQNNEYLGYVSDILFDQSGRLQAVYVVPDPDSPIDGARAYPFLPGPETFDPATSHYDLGFTEDEAVLFDQFDLQQLESERQVSP